MRCDTFITGVEMQVAEWFRFSDARRTLPCTNTDIYVLDAT